MTKRNSRIKNKLLTVLFGCLLINQATNAQVTNYFSLKQTVDYGIKNAVQVKNALLDIKIQAQTNRGITAMALPQINGSISTTHFFNVAVQTLPNFIAPSTYQVLIDQGVKDRNGNQITFPAGGFGNINAQFGVPWTASANLDVNQILFDGQVFVGLQARSAAMELAMKTADVTTEQIKANIYKVYWQLVVGKKQLSSIEANIERFEKLLHETSEIYKNGFAEKLDVDKVEVQLNNLRTEKLKAQNQIEAGYAGLKFLMNMPQKDLLVLSDSITEDKIKGDLLAQDYNYEDRKEYQFLTIAKTLNEYNVRRYKLSYLPTLAAFGTYSKNAQRTTFDFFKGGSWFTTSLVGLRLNVPIFDGFARSSRVQKAKIEVQRSNNNIEQLKSSIDNDVTQARLKITAAVVTLDNQKRNIELAEKVYNTTKIKYEQGLGSNQEIYYAQTELKVAQNNYYSALYDAVIAKIDFLKAAGKL